MKKNSIDLQDLAEFLRDAAYSDKQSHEINWRLHVLHPRTNDGDIGFAGGIWHMDKPEHNVSVSFSYSQTQGIYNFALWRNRAEIRFDFGTRPSLEVFKELIVKEFGIKVLYQHD